MIAPNSNIYLIKTPMELSDLNTLSFANETAKYNYFQSLPKINLDNATYQRKDGVLRYPTNNNLTYEDIIQYNYCMYQNTSYDIKWFYAYITDVKYINDGMVEISLKTDAFMTWQNDIVYKQSFIERQHVSDDTIGKHLIVEDVETGEFVINSFDYTGLVSSHVVIMSAWNPFANNNQGEASGSYLNGIYQGCDYFVIGDSGSLGHSDVQSISYFMGMMATQSKLDSVLGLFMIPDELTNFDNITWDYMVNNPPLAQYPYKRLTSDIIGNGAVSMLTKTVSKNYSSLNGYTPKNNKLFTSQFNYLLVSNNSGNNYTYNYEDFSTSDCSFDVKGVMCPGGAIKMYPKNYRGITNGVEYGINSGKYPISSFTGDMYTNWLTQNSVNISAGNFEFNIKPGDIGIASGVVGVGGGAGLLATGGGGFAGAGSILSGVSQIANSVKEQQYHEKMPPMFKGNINAGDLMFSMKWLDFNLYKMSIKYPFAKMIDDYFTMYGYKVNSLEVINPHKRTYFDYIKTIGCNIIGNIPQMDLEEIRRLFDNGITIWHNTSHFLDYSVNNSIL